MGRDTLTDDERLKQTHILPPDWGNPPSGEDDVNDFIDYNFPP